MERASKAQVRRRSPEDDARIVEIHRRVEPSSQLRSATFFGEDADRQEACGWGERWVAVDGDRLIGLATLDHAWWTGVAGVYAADVRVDPVHWGKGVGATLCHHLLRRLTAREATCVVGWARADAPEGRRFACRHGFQETSDVIEDCLLDVRDAIIEGQEEIEQRLLAECIRIASLAELDGDGEVFLRELHQVWAGAGEEGRRPQDAHSSLGAWRQRVLQGVGMSSQTHWVALDGERPVGMAFLQRLTEDAAENDYTVVASAYRGRGIARALKIRAICWARQNGVKWLQTSSDVTNARMSSINHRLGYRPGARRLELSRDLP